MEQQNKTKQLYKKLGALLKNKKQVIEQILAIINRYDKHYIDFSTLIESAVNTEYLDLLFFLFNNRANLNDDDTIEKLADLLQKDNCSLLLVKSIKNSSICTSFLNEKLIGHAIKNQSLDILKYVHDKENFNFVCRSGQTIFHVLANAQAKDLKSLDIPEEITQFVNLEHRVSVEMTQNQDHKQPVSALELAGLVNNDSMFSLLQNQGAQMKTKFTTCSGGFLINKETTGAKQFLSILGKKLGKNIVNLIKQDKQQSTQSQFFENDKINELIELGDIKNLKILVKQEVTIHQNIKKMKKTYIF